MTHHIDNDEVGYGITQ